ncbi:hypothetical protein [Rhodovibrio sodomensis]|nr:hypothetical protein [Rhodovibrio sodomensis]
METMRGEAGFKHEYPWGRKAPMRRLEELEAKRAEVERRRKLLRDRFEERMRDFDRMNELIDAEIEIAQRCESDRLRRNATAIAHRLLAKGIDVFEELKAQAIDEALIERLKEKERGASAPANTYGPTARSEGIEGEEPFPEDELIDEEAIRSRIAGT